MFTIGPHWNSPDDDPLFAEDAVKLGLSPALFAAGRQQGLTGRRMASWALLHRALPGSADAIIPQPDQLEALVVPIVWNETSIRLRIGAASVEIERGTPTKVTVDFAGYLEELQYGDGWVDWCTFQPGIVIDDLHRQWGGLDEICQTKLMLPKLLRCDRSLAQPAVQSRFPWESLALGLLLGVGLLLAGRKLKR